MRKICAIYGLYGILRHLQVAYGKVADKKNVGTNFRHTNRQVRNLTRPTSQFAQPSLRLKI